jgi:hypothetical protein
MVYLSVVDGGNSSLKVIVEGTQKLKFSNIVSDYGKVDYDLVENETPTTGFDKLDVEVTRSFDKNKDGKNRFLLGEMALHYKDSVKNRSMGRKSNDKQLADSMLSSLAFSIYRYKQKNKEKMGDKLTIRTNLATGLPYNEWKNKACRKEFKEMLEGNHLIKFHHPMFGGLEIELIVEKVLVLVEGESTLDYLISSEDSDFSNTEESKLIDVIACMIDIGAYTTEIISKQFVLLKGEEDDEETDVQIVVRTMPQLSKGIERGVGHVFEDTISSVEKNEKVDKLIRKDIERAFEKEGIRNGQAGYLVGFSEDINITDYFMPLAVNFAKLIAQEFKGLFNTSHSANKVQKIYITGGGSKSDIIVSEIKKILDSEGYASNSIITLREPNPIYSNAYGYYVTLKNEVESQGEED